MSARLCDQVVFQNCNQSELRASGDIHKSAKHSILDSLLGFLGSSVQAM